MKIQMVLLCLSLLIISCSTGKKIVNVPAGETVEVDYSEYKNYKALVFPSMHDSGGFVILEAALSGIPTIAYDHGGPSALIKDNETGLLSEIGSKKDSIDNLAQSLLAYSEDSNLCYLHGQNAQKYVTSNFLWEQKALFMKDTYNKLLRNRS